MTWAEIKSLMLKWLSHPSAPKADLYFLFLLMFLFYFWDRERETVQGGERQRERETESEVGTMLWAVSAEPHAGLELMNGEIMTWAKFGRLTNWATQEPHDLDFQWNPKYNPIR